MAEKGLTSQQYRDRLQQETSEIDKQNEYEYFLGLHDSGTRFPRNENNLFIAYLLDLSEDFDIKSSPIYSQGEFPDIDIDYLPMIQVYLKNVWAPKTFGPDKVCNIGNYTTFGIKMALTDMARVHGVDIKEIQSITTKLGLKDELGKEITFDKAVELYNELKDFCEEHPEIADSAKRIISRNRGRGKHAGGLVIANCSIDEFVPMVVDTDGNPVSAWPEGLAEQTLQPVGLIKFDVLVINDLLRIVQCCKLIKDRHNIDSICALPGRSDWSDISYLNDPDAIGLANTAHLKGIFQFDSQGMRELVKRGGVTSFEDLAAYSALYRPGPLGMKMHDRFIERKKGLEEYSLHPVLKSFLSKTYGVLCYQEQVMKVLNVVGGIPLVLCEKVRKAISKKSVDEFKHYKVNFLENGQRILGWPLQAPPGEDSVTNLWDQIEAFADYGFNASHAVAYTYISSRLLWLKVHYPLEFFATALSCESLDKKIKIYKLEAERYGIEIKKVDLNESAVDFEIVGKGIHIGFSKVKGIGLNAAKEIVAGQPYDSLTDFLHRIGTDANRLKPLIALGVFKEGDPLMLFEFYEYYKKEITRRKNREKRNIISRGNCVDELRYILPEHMEGLASHDFMLEAIKHEDWDSFAEETGLEVVGELDTHAAWKVVKKYKKAKESFEKKVADDKSITIDDFEPVGLPDSDYKKLLENDFLAEAKYYGFGWNHPLEKSRDFDGNKTFSQFEEQSDLLVACVEVQVIKKPVKIQAKKKKDFFYHHVRVEDCNWHQETITFWSEDYERFSEEVEWWDEKIERGNLLKMRVQTPAPGFKTYTFDSPPKHLREKRVPKKKSNDARIIVMENPESGKESCD